MHDSIDGKKKSSEAPLYQREDLRITKPPFYRKFKKKKKKKKKKKIAKKKRRNEAHRSRHRADILQVRLWLRVWDRATRRRQADGQQHEQNDPRSTTSQRHRGADRPRVHHQKGERLRETEQLHGVFHAAGQIIGEIRHVEDGEMGANVGERVLRVGGREKREEKAARRWKRNGSAAESCHTLFFTIFAIQMGSHDAQSTFPEPKLTKSLPQIQ